MKQADTELEELCMEQEKDDKAYCVWPERGALSLDAYIPGTDGLRLVDVIDEQGLRVRI
jgi:hypothetical protein